MSIISQGTWDNMPKEEKEKIRKEYMRWQEEAKTHPYFDGKITNMEDLFGKENLQAETIADKSLAPAIEHFQLEQQDNEWNKCSEQEQKNILEIYNGHPEWEDVIDALEDKFGKHNLHPEPKIKTWKDVEKLESKSSNPNTNMLNFLCNIDKKIQEKCVATTKIAKLIELGYGGIIRDEEWRDDSINKFSIVCEGNKLSIVCLPDERHFISFHYVQQAEEFMSHPDNKKLVEQYYMI